MQIEKLRSLIREAVDNQLKEIEAVAEAAAMEARLSEYDKAIKTCEAKIQAAENLEEVKDLMDEDKVNELKKKLKSLTKAKEKLEKAKAKKNKGKEVTTDAETDKMDETADKMDEASDKMDETYVEETYTMDEMDMKDEALNESFLKMQKLAGVITEGQYRKKLQMLNEGFLDNVAAGIKGKSEQGKLAQQILAKLGITKNPVEIFATGAEKGGAGPFENEVQGFIEMGGDINTKIPFSKNIKSSMGGAIFKETYTFDFSKDVPTMKSGGKFIWNIKGGKWEPFGDKDGNENKEEPIDIESMKKESDAEPGAYATEATMMTIADAAKIWPGGYGERLRDMIAEKSQSKPQQESLFRSQKLK